MMRILRQKPSPISVLNAVKKLGFKVDEADVLQGKKTVKTYTIDMKANQDP